MADAESGDHYYVKWVEECNSCLEMHEKKELKVKPCVQEILQNSLTMWVPFFFPLMHSFPVSGLHSPMSFNQSFCLTSVLIMSLFFSLSVLQHCFSLRMSKTY